MRNRITRPTGAGPELIVAKLGKLLPEELKGLVPVNRNLVSTRRVASGAALGENTVHAFFNTGIGDDATKAGFAAGQLTNAKTNLELGGKLPSPEVFIAYGLSLEFPDDITRTHLSLWDEAEVSIVENSGQTRVPLGYVPEIPELYGKISSYSGGADPATEIDVHNRGVHYMSKDPLFIMRGRVELAEGLQVQVKWFETAGTTTADIIYKVRAMGVWYRIPPVERPAEARLFANR